MEGVKDCLVLVRELAGLKDVTRTAWTKKGRRESTAEHSWRLALFAALFMDEFPEMDREKVLMMCLLHDLGESYDGDISAVQHPDAEKKYQTESEAVRKVLGCAKYGVTRKWEEYWLEYEQGTTLEAKFVKALDKAETILQHNQGKNPEDFNYEFNLDYGKELFQEHPLLREIRRQLDEETRRRIKEQSGQRKREP